MILNRNTESHFSNLPSVKVPRSIMDRSFDLKTTCNSGDVVPLYWDYVLPGDTVKMQTSKIARLQTLLKPIFDNVYLDTYWFFTPMQDIWTHTREFFGENTSSAWAPTAEFQIPQIIPPENGWNKNIIADYLGVPLGVDYSGYSDDTDYKHISALPFRAYAKVCDEFFRDENLTDPLEIYKGDSDVNGVNSSDSPDECSLGGRPFRAAKFHDYFTSCLPSAQRGDAVALPLPAQYLDPGYYPVTTIPRGWDPSLLRYDNDLAFYGDLSGDGSFPEGEDGAYVVPGLLRYSKSAAILSAFTDMQTDPLYHAYVPGDTTSTQHHNTVVATGEDTSNKSVDIRADRSIRDTLSQDFVVFPDNLATRFPGIHSDSGVLEINQLRNAFVLQHYLERSARSGGRLASYIRSAFGVSNPNSDLERSEYLGGNRITLNCNQVTNTANSSGNPLGDVGAMSVTSDNNFDFEKSFSNFGILMCLAVVRYDHSYSQGLSNKFAIKDRFDFYDPAFANLGEMPVLNREIYLSGTDDDNDVFGYQEAWASWRYAPSVSTSEMRPDVSGSLAVWHLGDNYAETPYLSDEWIREDKSNLDRALAVTSAVSNQIMLNYYFNAQWTRCMPMYSVPGLTKL